MKNINFNNLKILSKPLGHPKMSLGTSHLVTVALKVFPSVKMEHFFKFSLGVFSN